MSDDTSQPADPAAEPAGESRSEIKHVLERAITDPEFKARLLEDPDQALEGYQLTEVQMLLIKSMDEHDLEKLTPENLNEYFSVDAAVYTPEDADQVQGYTSYSADDLQDLA